MKIAITGASSGIGAMLAESLLEQGDEVWGVARRKTNSAAQWRYSSCDVSDWEQVELWANQIGQQWGELDAVICAAAIQGAIGPVQDTDPKLWRKTVEVNLIGTYYTVRALWKYLKRSSDRAKIICFSGGGASKARPGFAAYAASKTGVVRLVETLAAEWDSYPIDINAVAPGAVLTQMTEEILAAGIERVGQDEFSAAQRTKAAGQAGRARISALIEFLLSPQSDRLSGRFLSAQWDDIEVLKHDVDRIVTTDAATLRRVSP